MTTSSPLASSSEWEKEFFITWQRLMERERDGKNLIQTLHNILSQSGDASSKLLDIKHHANIMSANEKTKTELMAQLNEFFFRNVVTALKQARKIEPTNAAYHDQQKNPLDWYLEHGEDGPQTVVDEVGDWTGPVSVVGQQKKRIHDQNSKKKKQRASNPSSHESHGVDGINHDMTAMHSTESLWRTRGRVSQDPVVTVPSASVLPGTSVDARTSAKSTSGTKLLFRSKVKGNAKSPEPAINTITQSKSGSRSKAQTKTQLLAEFVKNNRVIKSFTFDLVAKQVLGRRRYAHAKEYLVQWQDVATPLWITRSKCPLQAREVIDTYVAALPRQSRSKSTARRSQQDAGKKTASHGTPLETGVVDDHEPKFYPVSRLLAHRDLNNKRQYLVHWENYPENYNTWENADSLRSDVPNIVEAYEKKLQQGRNRRDARPMAKEVSRSKSTSKRRCPDVDDKNHAHGCSSRKRTRRWMDTKNEATEGKTRKAKFHFDVEEGERDEGSDDLFTERLNQC
ncbi:hypothetical protein PsorP6_010224 [Peronosclerospora sorghi]|uniref:Uncharacterized protein n=1 Tax=Peronosclerospora sorghi TaxID=230839 RepID=A0ACC0VVH4_9STRA|nr:hypothetical protein PsorP6_010224 [Peronosclerospora sorghi]